MTNLDNHIYGMNLYPYDETGMYIADTVVIEPPSVNRFGIKFRYDGGGTSVNAEFEWRWRRRMNPAAAYAVNPYGEDVWVAWDGADLASGTYTVVTDDDEWGPWQTYKVGSYTPTAYTTNGLFVVGTSSAHKTLSVPYDVSTYDYAQLQVRGRLYGPGGSTSEWAVMQKTFIFRPVISAVSGWLNDDGTATLQGVTNWTRPNNLLAVEYLNTNASIVCYLVRRQSYEVPDDWEVIAPPEAIVRVGADSSALYPRFIFTTGDGAAAAFGYENDRQVLLGEPTPVTPIPEPTVTIDEDGNVTIDGSYDSVTAFATYSDEEGNTYQELLSLVEEGGSWSAALQTPPFDVEFEVAVVVAVGDDWQRYVQTMFVAGDGALHFDWPATDSHFTLRYNLMRQYSVDIQANSTPVAGRKLPVSRYGGGHTSKMTINGTLVNPAKIPAIGDMWIDALAVLEEPHDWILRAPGGMRRRISIETYVPQFDDATAGTLAAVTITANEVDDDGLD